jgi:hypothetical protein
MAVSDAFGIEIPRAASVASLTVQNGLVPDFLTAMDLMAAGLSKVPVDARGDFVDAIEEYTPFLKEIGFSGEEAFGAISASASKGRYNLDKTSDALKEFRDVGTDLGRGDTLKAYQILGLNADEMAKKIAEGGPAAREAFSTIITEMNKLEDPVAKRQAAVGLFGDIFNDLQNFDVITAMLPVNDALGQTEGKAMEMGNAISDNTSGAFDRGMRTMETEWNAGLDRLVSSPGESLGALVEEFENNFTALGEPIGGLWDKFEEFIGEIPGWIGGAWEHIENIVGEIPGWLGGLWEQVENLFGKIPEALGKIFEGLESLFLDPLKTAWNAAADWFNGLTFPTMGPWDIDAGPLGSFTIGPYGGWDLPDLPKFDQGGVVPGTVGSPQLILAHGGETVLPTHKPGGGMAGGVTVNQTINTVASPSEVAQVSTALLMRRIRPR